MDLIWDIGKSSKLTSYMIGMAYKTSVLGEGSCLRLRTRAQNWCPVWFVTSSRTSVVGMWISFKTWDKSTKLTFCVIWDISSSEMDLVWDMKQRHQTDVLCDLGRCIGHRFWGYWYRLRNETRAQNWHPVCFGTSCRTSVLGYGSRLRQGHASERGESLPHAHEREHTQSSRAGEEKEAELEKRQWQLQGAAVSSCFPTWSAAQLIKKKILFLLLLPLFLRIFL